MQRGRRALLHVAHRKAFQDIQHLQQHDAAGRGQRHRDDVIAAIAAAHRRADHGLIGFEIVQRHDAAGVADRLRQLFGDRPLVKPARALFGNRRERRRQIGLHQPCRPPAARCRRRGKRSWPMPASAPAACAMPGKVSAMSSAMTKPSRASSIAGFSRSASVNLPEPYFSSASASPATVPGTPMPSAESRDFAISGLPSAPRNMSRVVAAGAVSR